MAKPGCSNKSRVFPKPGFFPGLKFFQNPGFGFRKTGFWNRVFANPVLRKPGFRLAFGLGLGSGFYYLAIRAVRRRLGAIRPAAGPGCGCCLLFCRRPAQSPDKQAASSLPRQVQSANAAGRQVGWLAGRQAGRNTDRCAEDAERGHKDKMIHSRMHVHQCRISKLITAGCKVNRQDKTRPPVVIEIVPTNYGEVHAQNPQQ